MTKPGLALQFPSAEFDDAVAAVCHGTATEAEAAALNAVLRNDARARDEYLLRLELHSRLASEPDLFFPSALSNPKPFADEAAPASAPRPGDLSFLTPAAVRSAKTRKRLVPVLALAAGFALAALGFWGIPSWRAPQRPGATSTAVAMLTRAVDARWDPTAQPPRVGNPVQPGWLRLESGLAQVVFYSGARVVIEGPAEVRLVSAREVVCRTGRLLAEVPEPARGFQLRTEQLHIVDLGTSFGIDARADRTEVHVFKGKVELLTGPGQTRNLGETEAASVRGGAPPQLMAANATAFTAMFEFQQRSLASEAFRYEQWQFANAQLNEDPTLVVHLDFENLRGADWSLPNAAVHNRAVSDAAIVGCARAEGRWREKQALEFQSVNDRVRLVVPGEFESLTLTAWVCVLGLDRQFNSLFMCDGFAPGTVHWLIRDDGVLGITVFGEGPGAYQIMASPPKLTLDKLGLWLHLAVVLDGASGQAVHYVNGEPVSRHALELGPPFRIGSAELGNWDARSGSNPTPVLIRNLSGVLDEFGLFSRALSDAELRELYLQGRP